MSDTSTSNLGLTKPEDQHSDDTWGIKLNADLDMLDAKWDATLPATQVLGTAGSAGSSKKVARADHVHPQALLAASDIGTGVITSSKLALDADVAINAPGKGIVLLTPDGLHTYRLAITNNGELTTEQLT